jgi:hypothetical protein
MMIYTGITPYSRSNAYNCYTHSCVLGDKIFVGARPLHVFSSMARADLSHGGPLCDKFIVSQWKETNLSQGSC